MQPVAPAQVPHQSPAGVLAVASCRSGRVWRRNHTHAFCPQEARAVTSLDAQAPPSHPPRRATERYFKQRKSIRFSTWDGAPTSLKSPAAAALQAPMLPAAPVSLCCCLEVPLSPLHHPGFPHTPQPAAIGLPLHRSAPLSSMHQMGSGLCTDVLLLSALGHRLLRAQPEL